MKTGTKVTMLAGLVLTLGLACGEGAEVSPPAPVDATDEAGATDGAKATDGAEPGGRKAKLGKGKGKAKAGKRPQAQCPDGVVAAPSWPGEYPEPVVDVFESAQVKAAPQPCGEATLDCELPAGIYHPWSETDGETEYVTVRAIQRYKALKTAYLGEIKVEPGEIVEVYQYLGEGFCSFVVRGQEASDTCPGVADETAFELLPGKEIPEKHLFSLACGGKTAWVDADALLTGTPGVRRGVVMEWGKIGPGGKGVQ